MDHYDKIVNILDRPYFKNLETMGISDIHYEEIFKRLYNETISIYDKCTIVNKNRKTLYYESNIGDWYRYEYDENGERLYYEDSNGMTLS